MVIEFISSLLILLFVYAAISKLIDHRRFIIVLEQFPFVKSIAPILGWLIPLTELVIAGLLFLQTTKVTGLFASLILLLFFTAFLLYMIVYYPKLPCNCGGVLQMLSWKQHIIFNLLFILLSSVGIIIFPGYKLRDDSPP